ncbi:DUF2059 domain-containing protein [Alteromonas gilva]|uniref:DUF2059 domain-containing protein n=1 Tax=Alteromonas gilva TaxID=2987522 RepID=A0ABT5L0N0_9ALTE|nr:DUF2059 domain-containing protein [Alteromonas gilva]MDC8830599.1 DUF2059 domain-containing protein [Alteromonas gilva]
MKYFWLVLLTVCFSNAVSAADDARREKVAALLEATNADAVIDQIYTSLDGMFANMAKQYNIKESERPAFNAHMQKVQRLMRQEMGWQQLRDPMIELYLTHYTDQEIDGMLAFYQSDVGKAMVDKMPAVMAGSMQISQNMMQSVMPKLQALSEEYRQELQAKRESN